MMEEQDMYEVPKQVIDDPKLYQVAVKHKEQADADKQKPDTIIIHHTATPFSNDYDKVLNAINNSHAKRVHGLQPYNGINDSQISYHYVIFPDWTVKKTRNENRIGRHTRENNENTIWIVLVGNFQETEPTPEQYKALNDKIKDIQTRWKISAVHWHGRFQWEHTACPWKMFDYMKVDQIRKWSQPNIPPKNADKKYLWLYLLTKYYSCDKNQTKRLNWEKNTGQDNYQACNKRQFNWDLDNTMPKDGVRYTNKDAWIAVACSKDLYWKTLIIENRWEVKCRDVGSAIWEWRIDVYVWIWDWAIDNYFKYPSWNRKIRLK